MHIVLNWAGNLRQLEPVNSAGLRAREVQNGRGEIFCEIHQPGQEQCWIRVEQSFDVIMAALSSAIGVMEYTAGQKVGIGRCPDLYLPHAMELCRVLQALHDAVDPTDSSALSTGYALFKDELKQAARAIDEFQEFIARNRGAGLTVKP